MDGKRRSGGDAARGWGGAVTRLIAWLAVLPAVGGTAGPVYQAGAGAHAITAHTPRADSIVVDPCSVAPVDQLRFVVSAGLGRLFPLRAARDNHAVTMRSPSVVSASCPALRVDVALKVHEEAAPPGSGTAMVPSARVETPMRVSVTMKQATPGRAGDADQLSSASLCVQRVDALALGREAAPAWLTPAWIQASLARSPLRHACFDVTSLVYVFLQRGGRLSPIH